MFRFLGFIKSILFLNSRLSGEKEMQVREGYSIESGQAGPERYDIYREGEKEVHVLAEYSRLNDVTVHADSFRQWSKPRGLPLSDLEFLRVKKRVKRYFECWGGEVVFDDIRLPTTEDFVAGLNESGIPYEIDENGVIHYTVDIEVERKRPGGFFDRK